MLNFLSFNFFGTCQRNFPFYSGTDQLVSICRYKFIEPLKKAKVRVIGMLKRGRIADVEIFETFASLLRQSASRAVERFKLHRMNATASNSSNNASRQAPYPNGRSADERAESKAPRSAVGSTASRGTKPIDILVIQYCMYYLDLSAAPPNYYIRLAQEILTASSERVLMPRFFARIPLPLLCEGLIAEYPAEAIQVALREIEEYVEVRTLVGDWIDEHANDEEFGEIEEVVADGHDKVSREAWKEEVNSDEEAGGTGFSNIPQGCMMSNPGHAPLPLSTLGLASLLHRSLEFWVRIQNFLHAASLSGAKAHAFALHPRYESELMQLLRSLTLPGSRKGLPSSPARDTALTAHTFPLADRGDPVQRLRAGPSSLADGVQEYGEEGAGGIIPDRAKFLYERPDSPSEREGIASDEPPRRNPHGNDNDDDDDDGAGGDAHTQDVATTVLADTLALSHCPLPRLTDDSTSAEATTAAAAVATLLSAQASQRLKGVHSAFYTMVHARLSVMVARDRLGRFGRAAAVPPPGLTAAQRGLDAQQRGTLTAGAGTAPDEQPLGVPLEYIPDDHYFRSLLEKHHEGPMDEDEEIYKDEVVDYYLRHPWRRPAASSTAANATPRGGGGRRQQPSGLPPGPANLVKPHRFCKVKTGFTWTQYNRTHYDARTNPPPRTVLWYEFTLFYPALVDTKRDMRNIFRIENTPKGQDDDYCLLVFSVGPPYADVAYRIVRKQWDTRRGGVRISFDSTGRYKLFFRFTNSNYRR